MSETQAASSSDSYDTLPPPLPHPLVVRLKRKASPIPLDDVGRDRIPEGTDGQADNDEDGVLSLRVSHIESVADVASEEGSTRTIMVHCF